MNVKPMVYKAGHRWYVVALDLMDWSFPSWREAFDHAFVLASVEGAARIRQAFGELS